MSNLFKTIAVLPLTVIVLIAFSNSLLGQDATQSKQAGTTEPANEQEAEAGNDEQTEELYERLAGYLTGTKWTGQFTISDKEMGDLTTEEYYILSAEKMEEGDYWKLVARIKYGKNDVTMPLPLEIKWAGETPVITVDKMLVPTLGTFDARVLIRNGKYSGTWAHNEVGGHLFGEIAKLSEEELAELTEQNN